MADAETAPKRRSIPDLTGQTFHRLMAVETVPHKSGRKAYRCLCSCGGEKVALPKELYSGHLKSCGCLRSEIASKRAAARNRRHGMRQTRTYSIWQAMRARCERPSCNSFELYGGSGIRVCDRWQTFEIFLEDMGECPSPDHSIDRIDNAKGYDPENCRWATMEEQHNNRRDNRPITLNGETLNLGQWAKRSGMSRHKISDRLERGWSIEKALSP